MELILKKTKTEFSIELNLATMLLAKPAPTLEVATWIHGEPTTLESLRGTPVVLAFCKIENKSSEMLSAV